MNTVVVTDYVSPSKVRAGTDAEWYYAQACKGNLAASLLELCQSIIETVSLVGISSMMRRHEHMFRLQKRAEFISQPIKPIPEIVSLDHKTRTYTRNHLAEFAIESGEIWMRRKGIEWRPIHYEGKEPLLIDCDGANLIVVDEEGVLHFKKVFAEFRRGEIPPRKLHHFTGINLDQYDYYSIDKSQIFNWRKRWFVLPLLGTLYYALGGSDPKIDLNDYHAVAISHRGKWCNHYENYASRRHINVVGTSMLTLLPKIRRCITTPDPWVPPFAKVDIPLMEDEETYVEGVDQQPSASTVVLLGFQRSKKTNECVMKLFTRLCDIDVVGGNPYFKYSYDENDETARILSPHIDWLEHALPTTPNHIRGIDVLQTGHGNSAREIHIITDYPALGYYKKKIDETKWTFVRSDNIKLKPHYQPSTINHAPGGKKIEGLWKGHKIIIPFWGPGVEGSPMYVQIGQQTHKLYLRKRFSLWNFFGFDKPHVDVILPKEERHNHALSKLFGGQVSMPFKLA